MHSAIWERLFDAGVERAYAPLDGDAQPLIASLAYEAGEPIALRPDDQGQPCGERVIPQGLQSPPVQPHDPETGRLELFQG